MWLINPGQDLHVRSHWGEVQEYRGPGDSAELVWPSGKALLRLVNRRTSVRFRFGSPFCSKAVVRLCTLLCDFVPHN